MMRARSAILACLAGVVLLIAAATERRVVYHNARIHTLASNNAVHEAMLVVDDRIVAVGSEQAVLRKAGSAARRVDLAGHSVLPGFIDAHSHFPSGGLRHVAMDLSPPPIGVIDSREALLARIADAARQPGERWLLGFNYDNTVLAGGLHPTRRELDAISGRHPVYLWHSSGHMGVANSAALAALGIDERTEDRLDARLGRDPIDGRLTGLLQEKAAAPLSRLLAELPKSDLLQVLTRAREEYLAAGVTTVQNGHASAVMLRVLDWAEWLGILPQRVVLWLSHDKLGPGQINSALRGGSRSGLQRGAVKLIVDGSPQGLTALLREPYFVGAGTAPDYRGVATMTHEALQGWVRLYHRAGYQLAIHGNGDGAIDRILDAIDDAQREYPRDDARHLLVHAQTVRLDQIQRMSQLDVSASFFTGHTYYWGDWHRDRSLGPQRAATISPARWAQQAQMRFSLHADTPVTPMSPMQMLWSATRRITYSGEILGADQRISRRQALRALTIDAAWQNFIDTDRGSLEAGKLADFVVLSDDPLNVEDVREIDVMQTWIGGELAYRRPAGNPVRDPMNEPSYVPVDVPMDVPGGSPDP